MNRASGHDSAAEYEKLVELELATSGVDRILKAFDYSEQEWTDIELAAQRACAGLLTEEVRQSLRRAANVHHATSLAGRDSLKQNEIAFSTNWKIINELAVELSDRLFTAYPRSVEKKHSRLFRSLQKLQRVAAKFAGRSLPLPPREIFYQEIFSVWTDQLGGRLGFSRDARSQKLGGPLVKFFQAVTQPVLMDQAPALESIARIISREKERRKAPGKANKLSRFQKPRSAEEARLDYSYSSYTDLGPFRTDDMPFESQVHDYLVDRGNTSGRKHIVAVGADGHVLAHGFGLGFVRGSKFVEALDDPTERIVLHIGTADATLSRVIMLLLGSPGLQEVILHVRGGHRAQVKLTEEARFMLRSDAPQQAIDRLGRIHTGLVVGFYQLVIPSVRAGAFAGDQAETMLKQFVINGLDRADIVEYHIEQVPKAKRSSKRA